ncbi:MAG: hypothetical protein S4CHLAM6_07820 [Chlamydiae bacterium]|nr:hypothetical protein [Chlamydiota bacterium]
MAKKSSKHNQGLIQKELVLGLLLSLGLYYIFYFVVNWTTPMHDEPVMKLVFGLKWLIYPVACFWLGVLVVLVHRILAGNFTPLFENPPKEFRHHVEYVFSTLQHLLLLFFAVVLFSVYMPAKNIAIIPAICLVFSIGRLFFWAGLCKGNIYSYFGRLMTFLTTVAPLMYLSVRILIMNFIK